MNEEQKKKLRRRIEDALRKVEDDGATLIRVAVILKVRID
jgi:hypothetical protein